MNTMKFLKSIIQYVRGLWLKLTGKPVINTKQEYYLSEFVKDFPDIPEPLRVYFLGPPGKEWLAGLACPCGCNELIELVLKGNEHPKWSATIDHDRKVTLRPSVWRNVGCKSHFFLTKGEIHWC